MTVQLRSALREAAARLAAAGVTRPEEDARILAAHAHGAPPGDLDRFADAPVPPRFWDYVTRRADREPVERITGVAWFRGLPLSIGPEVFVPRPETLAVVQYAVDWLRALGRPAPVIADLCSGSGVVALALATEFPGAAIHAVELDPGACERARANLAGTAVRVVNADAADALPELTGAVDLVVSNPPYIPLGGTIRDPEVREWDPACALWAGPDGLDVIRAVERSARRLLAPGGLLLLEHGTEQGAAVRSLASATGGWTDVALRPTVDDLFLVAIRRELTD